MENYRTKVELNLPKEDVLFMSPFGDKMPWSFSIQMGQKAVEIESVNDVFKMQPAGIWLDDVSLSPLSAGITKKDHLRVISVGLGIKIK